MSLTNEQIEQELNRMDKHSTAIHDEAMRIVFSMKGGITLNDAYMLDHRKKEIIGKLLKEEAEAHKKAAR